MSHIAASPAETLDLWLNDDPSVPECERTVFTVYYPTRNEAKALRLFAERTTSPVEAQTLREHEDSLDSLVALLGPLIAGWRNVRDRAGQPVPFDPKRIGDVLTETELWGLTGGILQHSQLSEIHRKKFVWRSRFATDNVASAAANGV
jgi:hypothetical protein